ncbi:MAG: 30S ribosomal protein S19e [Thermoplasmata archaeon]|nr:30S ribosomal protein S19e [Thermoplasmata archaeon]
MTTAFDVPAGLLIDRLASKLGDYESIKPPEWALFAKTGTHREKAPVRDDWWHVRAAAMMRKIYVKGSMGIERMSAEYGGRRDRGSAPYHAVRGSRKIAREVMKQLENSKLVKKDRGKGRTLTGEGQSLVDNTSHEILKELSVDNPELTKYL